ncbi:nucleosome assembly protein [Zopfochytrium polystomum]|nr:nucleosome assembly protein [Zopfochytrium polystomum]
MVGPLPVLSAEVKKRVNALLNLQDKHDAIVAKFREEVIALEKKYLTQYQPLFEKRSEIVVGNVEPSDEEAHREKVEGEEEEEAAPASSEPVKGIPGFWLTALQNHPMIASQIHDRDEDALKSLTNITYSYLEGNPGFKLVFTFKENDYFSNTTLEKSYFLENGPVSATGDIMYDHAEGTKIDWKEGKDLSVTIEIKKQRHKASNKTRTVKKVVPAETFFNFFSPPKPPANEEEEVDDDLDEKLEMDYEIGDLIKEKIIPNAVHWFTGDALEGEDFDDEDDEGDEGELDDEEGEDDDEVEGEGGEKPQECKQQ